MNSKTKNEAEVRAEWDPFKDFDDVNWSENTDFMSIDESVTTAEQANKLARKGLNIRFVGSEPSIGISMVFVCSNIFRVLGKKHYQNWQNSVGQTG